MNKDSQINQLWKTIVKRSTFFAQNKQNSLKNKLIQGTIGSFGLNVSVAGLGFLFSWMLARWLGKEGLGVFSYAITWTRLLRIPANLGLSQLLVREIAIYQTRSDWGLMRGMINWSNRIVTIVSIALTLLTIAIALVWMGGSDSNSQMLLAVCVALIALPLTALRSLRQAVMSGIHQVVLGQLPEMFIAPLLLIILTAGSYLWLGKDLDAIDVLVINLLVTAITFIIGAWLLHRSLPKIVSQVIAQYERKRWLRSVLPMMFLEGMLIINSQLDILMLGAMKGSAAVGIYVVISWGTQTITFILGAVNSVLAPTIARVYTTGELKQLQTIVTKSARVVLVIACLIAGLLIGGNHWFLSLFGSDFLPGKFALIILSIGCLVNAATGSVGQLLTMTGHENYIAISTGISVLLNALLNALLIPKWGINGAAIATSATVILINVVNVFWLAKKVGINSTAFGKIKKI